jgi:nitrogen fixation NifU-like protein
VNEHTKLSKTASQHANHPCNYGPLSDSDGYATITGPCGDTMEFWLRVQAGKITGIRFTTTGCGSSRAAGSMATQLVQGQTLWQARDIQQADILNALDGLPREAEHCALLAANTLKAAIADAMQRAGAADAAGGTAALAKGGQ